jgi:hypothetical protein
MKILNLLLITGLLFLSGLRQTYARAQTPLPETNGCSIVAELKTEFQKRNAKIANVKIVDMRPTVFGPSKYLVVGWGVRADLTFKGDFADELFGLFLVDGSLSRIEKTIDFIPTPRWLDAEMRITKLDADYVVLEATGETYGGTLLRRKYQWRK